MLVRCTKVGVTVAIAHLVAAEVLDVLWLMMRVEVLAVLRILAVPPIMVIVVVIDVAPEMGGAVEPRSCADEDAARKPLRPVVAIWRAFIRRIVEIAVRADRRGSNLYCDLCLCFLS